MWSMAMDELLGELSGSGYYATGIQMIAMLINVKLAPIVSEVLQTALGLTQQWCNRTDLSINPSKTVVIPFTKKRALKGLKETTLLAKLYSCPQKSYTLD
jgi:hypothetical protein